MISVNVKFIGRDIVEMMVSGHANYDQYGKDLVCAAVSAIVTGGINALEKYKMCLEVIHEENLLGVKIINNNSDIQTILNTILIQLETIEKSYQENIKIKHGGV